MSKTIPTRGELEVSSTWDLSPLFKSDGDWENAFIAATEQTNAFPALAGTLSESPEKLLYALERESVISLSLERLYVYAHMRRDEDNALTLYQGMTDRAMQLMTAFGAASAFMSPEILDIDERTFNEWLQGDTLKPYKRVLKNIARARAHTLKKGEERLLALSSEPLSAASQVFTMLNNADLRFEEIVDDEGETVELTQENYRRFIESHDRSVRESAYRALYKAYGGLKNTLAASYAASVKADVFAARARNHQSALKAALFSGNVPIEVYDGLIDAMQSRLHHLGGYLDIRRNKLGLDALHMFDLYVPIVEEKKRHMEYADAVKLVKDALSPLGKDYAGVLDKAASERWIDVCENRGKTTGAYSWGAYGSHPYVLLNYQPDMVYSYTLAHELGHALHSYYSDKEHPYQDAQYRIMAAEVASTVNEILLTKYLLKTEEDEKRRAYVLNHYLEQFRTTVYRQTMFAAFERQTHYMCEAGEPLTVDSLSELYGELNRKYYPGVVIDDEIKLEWARIPHFYRAFYVYQYATGFCAAVKIAKDILQGEPQRHIAFLKSGGSDYPIELLKRAGVDLTEPNSILTSLDEFGDCVKELAGML